MEYLLAVDVGSSSVKTALFDTQGNMVALSIQEYDLLMPAPDIVEIEPQTFWEKFKAGVTAVLGSSRIIPVDIKAMAISSQGETFITLDKNGRSLRPAIFWLDNRAIKETEILAREFDRKKAYHITGMPEIVPMWTAGKILWMKKHEPEIFKKAAKFLLVEDYLIFRLTGKYVGEYSCYPSTMLLDIQKKQWWTDMLDFIGIDTDQLAELKESGEPVGLISRQAASELGLSPKTLVATGGYDHAAGAIGSGNIKSGIVTETTGSALVVNSTIPRPLFDSKLRVPCQYHAVKDMYFLSSFSETGGMALRWFRDKLCPVEIVKAEKEHYRSAYAVLDEESEKIPVGSEGLIMLPFLAGAFCPESDSNARGVYFGLSLKHGRMHMARALMESIAFMLKRHVEVVEEMGVPIKEIIAMGGGARSRLWRQIKADVLEKPVLSLTTEEPSLLGAAILAGLAKGIYKDLVSASEQMVHVKERLEPKPAEVKLYRESYGLYVRLYEKLADLFPTLRTLTER